MSDKNFYKVRDDFEQLPKKALSLEAAIQGWFMRNLLPMYKNAQIQRWMTQNASEGETWKPISSSWIKRKQALKIKDEERYPGGQAVMIFTKTLFKAVTTIDRKFSRVLATSKTFTVATTLPYAKYANAQRPFVGFGKSTDDKFKNEMTKFIRGHLKRSST